MSDQSFDCLLGNPTSVAGSLAASPLSSPGAAARLAARALAEERHRSRAMHRHRSLLSIGDLTS